MARHLTDRKRVVPPLDAPALERLALHYVGRYATTRAKLAAYLARKIAERGWTGETRDPVPGLVARIAALGYVDDRAFAEARAGALARRGYGARRIGVALRGAGIAEEDAAPVRAKAAQEGWAAAVAFARRRRIGPFAREASDQDIRRKALGALLRAGHDMAHARRLAAAQPGDPIEEEG